MPHTVTLHIPTTMAAKEELGARIPTISGYKMLDFPAVVLTVGMEETQHVGAKVNVVNVLPSSEL